jgi:hypothetical protein
MIVDLKLFNSGYQYFLKFLIGSSIFYCFLNLIICSGFFPAQPSQKKKSGASVLLTPSRQLAEKKRKGVILTQPQA